MSKKIISAILVMAMVISMSATALLSSVGAAAETDYEADRKTLKASIQNLVVYGPELDANTIILLKQTGILTTFNDDLNCTCGCGEWVELHNRNSFWKKYTDATAGITEDDYLFRATTDVDAMKAEINAIIVEAASAYYFGQDANNELVDATFNEGRNNVVKNAISSVNGIYDILKAEVGSTAEEMPEAYADMYYGEFYKGFATSSKAYNQAIGFNPYLFIIEENDYINDSYWLNGLGQYTIRWYTFAEAREIDAEGVFAFENAIRKIAIENCNGLLFTDFVDGRYAEFMEIVDSLFTNLVGKIDSYFGEAADIDDQIKAFLKLTIVIDIYDLYIKDVYNNIYTASAAELLNNVLYAKRIINYMIKEDGSVDTSKLFVLALTDFDTITNDILAGIEAVAPRSEQLLTEADITEGTALIRKAEALLANWSNWASNDTYKGTWNALNNAKNDLKDMMPATVGGSTVIVVAADTLKMKNIAGTEVGNDRVVVEFTPNWFAYVKFYALLEAQIAKFTNVLNSGKLDAPSFPTNDMSAVVAAVNKYAYLAGIVGNVLSIKDNVVSLVGTTNEDGTPSDQYIATVLYKKALIEKSVGVKTTDVAFTNYKSMMKNIITKENSSIAGEKDKVCLYEAVLGNVFGNNNTYDIVNQDVAIDSVYVLIETLINVIDYAMGDTSIYGTSEGSFDWTTDSYTFKSANDKAIEALEEAVANLTRDLTKEIQTYVYILADMALTFGWNLEWTGFVADALEHTVLDITLNANKLCWADSQWYTKDAMKLTVEAANKLAQHISETIVDKDQKNIYIYTTYAELIAAYNEFENAVKTYLLTDAGVAKFDKYIDDIYYFVDSYLGESEDWNNYDKLLEKLIASNTLFYKYVADMKYCYEYFALTLEHAAFCKATELGDIDSIVSEIVGDSVSVSDELGSNLVTMFRAMLGNRYFWDKEIAFTATGLYVNLIKPMSDRIVDMDVSGYTRDWAENYQAIRTLAAAVVNTVDVEAETINSDMPVWYAERVLDELLAADADKANYTVAGLVEYKAGLEALLIEADGLNVYNYVSNTDEAKAIWADFVDAYTNAQYVALDGRCPKANVDAAVEALTSAMAELEKIEAAEGAADADTLNAKIEEAKALLARADVTTADKTELELAIASAEKVLMFNISVVNATDIEAEIKVLDDLMNALEKDMYTGADLKKATKVLELQVVVDLYTEASYRKFANAVEAAYAMAEEDTATESAMMAAAANVEARFGDLQLAPVEEEPEVVEPEVSVVMTEAIEIYNNAANGYDKAVEGCTAESAAAYNAAINTLKADIEANADDAKLLESIIALNLAKAALTVDVPETCDC